MSDPLPRLRDHPRDYLKPDAVWPDGPLIDSAPLRAHQVQALALRLRQAHGDGSLRESGEDIGLNHQTIANLLNGDTWGSARTITTLETYLGIGLWGDVHPGSSYPREYVAAGHDWPDGALTIDAPREAHLAQAVARRLKTACQKTPLETVADNARVSPRAVHDIYNGTNWGDLATIARLEHSLKARLWGDEHLPKLEPRDYIITGQTWPRGQLSSYAPDDVEITRNIAIILQDDFARLKETQVARLATVTTQTIQDLYNGTIDLNLSTYVKLSEAIKHRRQR